MTDGSGLTIDSVRAQSSGFTTPVSTFPGTRRRQDIPKFRNISLARVNDDIQDGNRLYRGLGHGSSGVTEIGDWDYAVLCDKPQGRLDGVVGWVAVVAMSEVGGQSLEAWSRG